MIWSVETGPKPLLVGMVGFIGPETPNRRQKQWRDVMDGHVSHWSGVNCLRLGGISACFFAFLFPSLSFHLTVMLTSMLDAVFVLSRLFFSFT
jgi:hypothetical protein